MFQVGEMLKNCIVQGWEFFCLRFCALAYFCCLIKMSWRWRRRDLGSGATASPTIIISWPWRAYQALDYCTRGIMACTLISRTGASSRILVERSIPLCATIGCCGRPVFAENRGRGCAHCRWFRAIVGKLSSSSGLGGDVPKRTKALGWFVGQAHEVRQGLGQPPAGQRAAAQEVGWFLTGWCGGMKFILAGMN